MIRKASLLIILVICCGAIQASGVELTLDSCLARAERHYPLIRQYGLLDHTEALSLSDINKSWLPRLGLYGQATVQNSVPALPEAFSDLMSLMGQAPRASARSNIRSVSTSARLSGTAASRATGVAPPEPRPPVVALRWMSSCIPCGVA